MMPDKKEIPSGEDGIKGDIAERLGETVNNTPYTGNTEPPAANIHLFGIDPLAVSRLFMHDDLAKSGLVPSDFPVPPVPVLPVGGRGAYQLWYTADYYKLKIDRDLNKYVGLKGAAPPVVVLGNHHGAAVTASVEGLKKAVAFHIATGIPTLAIDSCWGFGEAIEDSNGLKVKDLHTEIIQQLTPSQSHLVLFDGDWATNDHVRYALSTYRVLLEEQGLKLRFVDIGTNEHGEKQGIDDWLVARYSNDRLGWPEPLQVLEDIFAIPTIPNEELLGGAQSFALHSINRFSKDYLDLSDRGAASLLIKLLGAENFKFLEDTGEWVQWNAKTKRWNNLGESPVQLVNIAAQHYLRRAQVLSVQAAKMEGRKELENKMKGLLAQSKEFAKFGKGHCSSTGGRKCVLADLATSRPELKAQLAQFDTTPHLLGVANGVVDLTTGELREERQEDMILRHCPTRYTGEEPPRLVEGNRDIAEFLDNLSNHPRDENMVAAPDLELREYLQRRFGGMLWGTNAFQGFDILTGPPATAKSTVLQLIRGALGDTKNFGYYCALKAGVVLSDANQKNPEAATPFLMLTAGARIVGMAETKDTHVFDEALIKQFSGEKGISGRANYKDGGEIPITYNFVLATNTIPNCTGIDAAFLERLAIMPIEMRWKRPNKVLDDPEEALLPLGDTWWVDNADKNQGVQEYVLWWLIQGCVKWKAQGLGKAPERMVALLKSYVKDNDKLSEWMADMGWVFDKNERTLSGEVYRSYKDWVEASGGRAVNASVFSRRLLSTFKSQLEKTTGTGNKNYISGIVLKP